MATIKPPVIELPEGVTAIAPTNANQAAAITGLLGAIDMANASENTEAPTQTGVKIYTDADGNSFAVADANEAGQTNDNGKTVFNLADTPAGTPVVVQGNGIDKVKGGDAGDKVINQSNDDTVFKTKGGDDSIVSTGFGNTALKTGEGNDYVVGGQGDDFISGGVGADTLSGTDGSDFIKGGEGDDVIDGGAGNNDLVGGEGSDTFIFDTDANGANTVEDFSKDDILKIADRNGDGTVTEGDNGDFTQEVNGGDVVIHLQDKDGNEDARIILKDAGKTLTESSSDDGTFTL